MQGIGSYIAFRRRELDLSFEEAAQLAGLTTKEYRNVERGADLVDLQKVMEVLSLEIVPKGRVMKVIVKK
jgi:transcriptional regulator with XRE-family HTH domain